MLVGIDYQVTDIAFFSRLFLWLDRRNEHDLYNTQTPLCFVHTDRARLHQISIQKATLHAKFILFQGTSKGSTTLGLNQNIVLGVARPDAYW